ncbi:MAG: hypothetical protein V3V45_01800, partial [Candidatus Brocadiales bacterium]
SFRQSEILSIFIPSQKFLAFPATPHRKINIYKCLSSSAEDAEEEKNFLANRHTEKRLSGRKTFFGRTGRTAFVVITKGLNVLCGSCRLSIHSQRHRPATKYITTEKSFQGSFRLLFITGPCGGYLRDFTG